VRPADHPTDERLLARYFDPSGADEALELHLFRCLTCAARRDAIAAALDGDHDRTLTMADGYFDASRLARQRSAILEKTARPRPARVLPFASGPAPTPAVVRAVRTYSRWTAAAAVLLLSAGAGSGWFWDGRQRVPRSTDILQSAQVFAAATLVHEQEDAVLSQIELALTHQQTAELLALDALTPRAGEQPINP
jgi:hypothetical protein